MNKYDAAIAEVQETGTSFKGDDFIILPETTSTMRDADEAIRQGAGHGHKIIALRQTNGIGSYDPALGGRRAWASPTGNLFLSMVVEINRARGEHNEQITQIAALAAGDIARRCILDPATQLAWHWPNDLWRMRPDGAGEKFGGALVPSGIHPAAENKVVLGLGVNIASKPNVNAMRTGAQNVGATTLHECGAWDMTIGRFVQLFDGAFKSQLNLFRLYGYGATLERMGFAHRGQVMLQLKETGQSVCGRYKGYLTEKAPDGTYSDYILLRNGRGVEMRYPLRTLTGLSLIPS